MLPAMIIGGTLVAAVAVATVLWLRRQFLSVTVRGHSMEPTLRAGDRVLARRMPVERIARGSVVVVASPPDDPGDAGLLIKRAAAVPGDPVPRERVFALRNVPGDTVPAGHLVVLGDNPSVSYDSRELGYIPPGRVLGVVVRPRHLAPPG